MSSKLNYDNTNLIEVDDNSEGIAETKDYHNPHQDHGNTLVPLLSAGGLLVQVADVGDGPVDWTVGDDQDDEGKKSHEKEVCEENIVSDVAWVFSHRGEANRVFFGGGIDDDFTSFVGFISPFDAGEEFIEPWNVPEDTQDDGGENIDNTGGTWKPENILFNW